MWNLMSLYCKYWEYFVNVVYWELVCKVALLEVLVSQTSSKTLVKLVNKISNFVGTRHILFLNLGRTSWNIFSILVRLLTTKRVKPGFQRLCRVVGIICLCGSLTLFMMLEQSYDYSFAHYKLLNLIFWNVR